MTRIEDDILVARDLLRLLCHIDMTIDGGANEEGCFYVMHWANQIKFSVKPSDRRLLVSCHDVRSHS